MQMSNSSRERDASRGPGLAKKTSVVRMLSQPQKVLQDSESSAVNYQALHAAQRMTDMPCKPSPLQPGSCWCRALL